LFSSRIGIAGVHFIDNVFTRHKSQLGHFGLKAINYGQKKVCSAENAHTIHVGFFIPATAK
jgi:hypothetical protein